MATNEVQEKIFPALIELTLTSKPTKHVEYISYLSKIGYDRSQNAISRYLKELGIKKNNVSGNYELPSEDLSLSILEVIKEELVRVGAKLITYQDVGLLCCTFYNESSSRYRFDKLIREAFSDYIITTIITNDSVVLITNSKDSSVFIEEKLVSLTDL